MGFYPPFSLAGHASGRLSMSAAVVRGLMRLVAWLLRCGGWHPGAQTEPTDYPADPGNKRDDFLTGDRSGRDQGIELKHEGLLRADVPVP
jgi:hypothetical protein